MKSVIIEKSLNIVKDYKACTETELEKIKYGIEGIYLSVSKLIIILTLSIIIGITREFITFTVFYNLLRMFAFGIHASKSYICLLCSAFVFLLIPYLSLVVPANIYINLIVGTFSLLMIVLYAPADTHKRPLINSNKRRRYKSLSFLVGIIYFTFSLSTRNSFLSNILIFSLFSETVLILPITYKVFKMPYQNYKTYKRQRAS